MPISDQFYHGQIHVYWGSLKLPVDLYDPKDVQKHYISKERGTKPATVLGPGRRMCIVSLILAGYILIGA